MKKFSLLIIMRSIFGTESFSAPVIAFFYLRHVGISLSEYSLSLTCMFLLTAFLQVPTGILSDRIGRKKVLIFGELLYASTWLALIIFPSHPLFYLSAVIIPIASALSSGNLESLAYEALSKIGKEDEFKKVTKASATYSILGGAIAGILGGCISKHNIALPLAIDTAIIFTGAFLSWIILPNGTIKASDKAKSSIASIFKTALEFSRSSNEYLNRLLIGGLLFAVVRTLFTIYGPLLSESKFDLSQVGLIIGSLTLISFGLVKFLPKLITKLENDYEIEITMVFIVVASGILGLWSHLVLGALLLQQILRIFSQYYSRYYINKSIPVNHESRVTLLSFAFLVNLLIASLFGALESYLISITNVNVAFFVICALAGIAVFSLSKLRKSVPAHVTIN